MKLMKKTKSHLETTNNFKIRLKMRGGNKIYRRHLARLPLSQNGDDSPPRNFKHF